MACEGWGWDRMPAGHGRDWWARAGTLTAEVMESKNRTESARRLGL